MPNLSLYPPLPRHGRQWPEDAELVEVMVSDKWIDLCYFDPIRRINVYLASRPTE